ncbi:MAG: DUF4214 domain-containing protein [Sulfitobacter sp.]
MSKETIIAEVSRLIRALFVPTGDQVSKLDAPRAEATKIMQGLPLQIADLRHDIAAAIEGLEPSDIEPADVAALLVLDRYVAGFSSNVKDAAFKRLDPLVMLGIGQRSGRKAAGHRNEIAALYHKVLRRPPDEAGFAFWSRKLREGVPLPAIRAAFEKAGSASKG